MVDSLQMFTSEEVCELLNVHINTLNNMRDLEIIKPIKTGKCFMYSRKEIEKFQDDYIGLDVSNRQKAFESKRAVEQRKETL